jgi:hypothetical protein
MFKNNVDTEMACSWNEDAKKTCKYFEKKKIDKGIAPKL